MSVNALSAVPRARRRAPGHTLRPGDTVRVPRGTRAYADPVNDAATMDIVHVRPPALVVELSSGNDWVRGLIGSTLWWFYPGQSPERI